MIKPAPIATFVYNRLDHFSQTIEALKKNDLANLSHLYIYSDGAKENQPETHKQVQEIRKYIKIINGFKQITIVEREKNQGLSKNIIEGVSEVVNKHGRVIVLEDDLVTSPYFLKYMNDALELYKDEDNVCSIHGYVYPVKNALPETFFLKGADCWGWATWKRAWKDFEPNGKKLLTEINNRNLKKKFDYEDSYPFYRMLEEQSQGLTNSWAIRWHATSFLRGKLTLYPGISFVQNIGNDGSGTHKTKSDRLSGPLVTQYKELHKIPTEYCKKCYQEFVNFFMSRKKGGKTFFLRVKTYIQKTYIKLVNN